MKSSGHCCELVGRLLWTCDTIEWDIKDLLRYFLLNRSNHRIIPREVEEHVVDWPHYFSGGLNSIALDACGISGSGRLC